MRHETRAKLDRQERHDRRRSVRLVVASVLLAVIFYFVFTPPYLAQRNVVATVVLAVVENDTGTGQRIMHIEADLDTGRRVLAGGRPVDPPRAGDRIVLKERRTWAGYHSYYWEGLRP